LFHVECLYYFWGNCGKALGNWAPQRHSCGYISTKTFTVIGYFVQIAEKISKRYSCFYNLYFCGYSIRWGCAIKLSPPRVLGRDSDPGPIPRRANNLAKHPSKNYIQTIRKTPLNFHFCSTYKKRKFLHLRRYRRYQGDE
jgi:hypothetical protein